MCTALLLPAVGLHLGLYVAALQTAMTAMTKSELLRKAACWIAGSSVPKTWQLAVHPDAGVLQAKGLPVGYIRYLDEGHGFARPPNRLHFYSHVEAFLAKHLGGRSQPASEDYEGNSAEILAEP